MTTNEQNKCVAPSPTEQKVIKVKRPTKTYVPQYNEKLKMEVQQFTLETSAQLIDLLQSMPRNVMLRTSGGRSKAQMLNSALGDGRINVVNTHGRLIAEIICAHVA